MLLHFSAGIGVEGDEAQLTLEVSRCVLEMVDHNFSPYLLLSSFLFDFLLFSLLAVVGYKTPAIATQSGHWLPQLCIAWNKMNKWCLHGRRSLVL